VSDKGVEALTTSQSMIKSLAELEPMGEAIGRGQSSYVVLAKHKPTGKQVVMKVINIYDQSNRHQVVKEVKALYSLKHKNVVYFYDAFFDPANATVVVVLEYMDCGALSNVLSRCTEKTVPEDIIGAMAVDLVDVLHYVHSNKLIHRDLKPQNICINSQGEVKLTDFGLTREVQNSVGNCRSILGTYSYMSPERISGGTYDYRSDIWSFGVILLECAMGKFPYGNCDLQFAMIQKISEDKPPKLPNPEAFDAKFVDFLDKCLQKDPELRATAETLIKHPWIKSCREDKEMRLRNQKEPKIKKWVQKFHLRLFPSMPPIEEKTSE